MVKGKERKFCCVSVILFIHSIYRSYNRNDEATNTWGCLLYCEYTFRLPNELFPLKLSWQLTDCVLVLNETNVPSGIRLCYYHWV
jgi:hypothetical protein